MKKDLPIFDIVLDDNNLKQGVGMISLVDDPAIGVNWIKLRSQLVDVEMSFTLTKDGICLGCPPTGDGTTKSGAKDKRCGDGVRKTSSKKPKAPKKEEPKKESKSGSDRIKNPTLEEPPSFEDYQKAELDRSKAALDKAIESGSDREIASAKQNYKDTVENKSKPGHPSYEYNKRKANNGYDDLVKKEISELPKVYKNGREVDPGFVRRDRTWDKEKGGPTKPPRPDSKRSVFYDRSSSEDIENGYDAYKINIFWD